MPPYSFGGDKTLDSYVENKDSSKGSNFSMSYKVLARKWRPQHFRDMLGQETVLRALVNALDTNRLHHAYLFTGMRGVGKTTIARIFAKCLNCETNGVSSDPCGTCSACQDIDAGRFFDLIEVDAASSTKVESTRELLENVPYAPASGRYKVYLIDEVHMFSTHSFNALLKTLEEPPEHVKFLLATTDPQKIPATVLSRCLQFNLKRMSPGNLVGYLSKILTEESIEFEKPALDLIARAAEGSVRDSLSLIEQAAASGNGAVKGTDVESMLGRASVDRLLQLIETLASGDMPKLFEQVNELADYAPEFSELLGEILTLLHRIAMLKTVPDSVSESMPGFDRLLAMAGSLDPDQVQLWYQIGLHARRDLPLAPDPRDAFDMALLRMHSFRPQLHEQAAIPPVNPTPSGTSVNSNTPARSSSAAPRVAKPEYNGSPDAKVVSGNATEVSPSVSSPRLEVRGTVSAGGAMRDARAAALAAARGEPMPAQYEEQAATTPKPKIQSAANTPVENGGGTNAETKSAPSAAVQPLEQPVIREPAAPAVVSVIDKSALNPADWPQLVAELDIAGMPLQLASNCTLAKVSGDALELNLEESSDHLCKAPFIERLQSALSTWFEKDIHLTIEQVSATLQTPTKISEKKAAESLAAAHEAIKQDPIVRQLIDKVDAAVDEASIRPIEQ